MRKQFLTYCLLLLSVVALSQKRIDHTRILVEDQGNGILFSWKKSTKGHKLTPLNGKYIILYDNYSIAGKYRKGLSQGILRRFGADGTLLQEAEYDDRGFPQGEKRCFYPNGKLECRTPFKQGRIDGLYEEWYENGARKTSAEMRDGLHDGITMSWDESGNILSKWNYAKNLRDGVCLTWIYQSPDTLLTEEYYRYDQLVDTSRCYRLESNGQQTLRNITIYDVNGKVLRFESFDGDTHCCLEYDELGQCRLWTQYTGGKLSGRMEYQNGQLHGKFIMYYPGTTKLWKTAQYEHGKLLSSQEFASDGTPITSPETIDAKEMQE